MVGKRQAEFYTKWKLRKSPAIRGELQKAGKPKVNLSSSEFWDNRQIIE